MCALQCETCGEGNIGMDGLCDFCEAAALKPAPEDKSKKPVAGRARGATSKAAAAAGKVS